MIKGDELQLLKTAGSAHPPVSRRRSPLVAAFAAAVMLGWAAHPRTTLADTYIPCLSNEECPEDMPCNWGLCEGALSAGSGVLFQITVFPVSDRTGLLAGNRLVLSGLRQRLLTLLGHSGHFRAVAADRVLDGDWSTALLLSRSGSAYGLLPRLERTPDGLVLILEFLDGERRERVDWLATRISVEGTDGGAALRDWANAFIGRFTGRPGILGTRLAFVHKVDVGIKEVVSMEFGSTTVDPQTYDRSLALLPAWAPTGEIAYTTFRTGYPQIFIGDRTEPFSAHDGMNSGIEWAPDGRVAAVTLSMDDNPEIYLLEGVGGKILKRLTWDDGIDTSPSFSPDGTRLAFVSDREGTPQIYVMDIDGSNVRRLTTQGGYNTSPDWHPYGPYLVYNSQHSVGFQIHRIHVETGEDRQLTANYGSSESPSWSPDGRLIVYTFERSRKRDLFLMNPDGSNQQPLTEDGGPYYTPAWERRRTP